MRTLNYGGWRGGDGCEEWQRVLPRMDVEQRKREGFEALG